MCPVRTPLQHHEQLPRSPGRMFSPSPDDQLSHVWAFHLYPCFLLIPKRSHSSPKVSSASSIAATNFTRSFIGDVSFQGMPGGFTRMQTRVTYVPGAQCQGSCRFSLKA